MNEDIKEINESIDSIEKDIKKLDEAIKDTDELLKNKQKEINTKYGNMMLHGQEETYPEELKNGLKEIEAFKANLKSTRDNIAENQGKIKAIRDDYKEIVKIDEILKNEKDENVIAAYKQRREELNEDIASHIGVKKVDLTKEKKVLDYANQEDVKEYLTNGEKTKQSEVRYKFDNSNTVFEDSKINEIKFADEQSTETSSKPSIQVDSSNLFADGKKAYTYDSGKKGNKTFSISPKKSYKTRMKDLMKDEKILRDEKYKKILKYVDPYIWSIMSARMSESDKKAYLDTLAGTNKTKLNLDVKFDLKGLSKNKNIKLLDKINLKRIANRHEKMGIAKVERDNKDKKLFRKIAAIFGASALLLTGGSAANTLNEAAKENNQVDPKAAVTDTIQPENNKDNTTPEKTPQQNFADSLKVDPSYKNPEKTEKTEKTEETTQNKNKLELSLGTVVNLPEGIKYTENSLGQGKSGIVGQNPYRDAGEYVVDGYSLVKQGQSGEMDEIVEFKYGVDSDINLADYIAQKSADENYSIKLHVSQGTEIDEEGKGTHPSGWVDSEKIVNELAKQQRESQNKTAEADLQR